MTGTPAFSGLPKPSKPKASSPHCNIMKMRNRDNKPGSIIAGLVIFITQVYHEPP